MMSPIRETIDYLTASVRDLPGKPLLRPVLEAELLKLGYSPDEVNPALDEAFKVTVQ